MHSPETTEDVIAHELMHGWLGLVRGLEDDRMYKNRQDSAAMFLVDTTQGIVLDCQVQEAIGARGFDPCFWTEEIVKCVHEAGVVLHHGLHSGSALQDSFMARLYALPEAVPHLFRFTPELRRKLDLGRNLIREHMPDLARLGEGIVQAFHEGSYQTNEDAHRLIDCCLLLMADYVGMDLDLEQDLEVWQPPEPKWVDKFPQMLPGWPVELKYEIHRRLIREGWPAGTLVQATPTASDRVQISFYPSAGLSKALASSTWEWRSPRPLTLPRPPKRFDDALALSSPADRMRPRSWELLNMGKAAPTPAATRSPAVPKMPPVPGMPHPSHAPQAPRNPVPVRPASHLIFDDEPFTPRRGGPTMRYYLPGIGRFISRVHLHQAVAMGATTYEELRDTWGITIRPPGTPEAFASSGAPEHPYAYCDSDPLNWVDPEGDSKRKPGQKGKPKKGKPRPRVYPRGPRSVVRAPRPEECCNWILANYFKHKAVAGGTTESAEIMTCTCEYKCIYKGRTIRQKTVTTPPEDDYGQGCWSICKQIEPTPRGTDPAEIAAPGYHGD